MQNDLREAVARIIDGGLIHYGADGIRIEDFDGKRLPEKYAGMEEASQALAKLRTDAILALLSARPLALGGQQEEVFDELKPNDIAAILEDNADADADGLHNASQLAEAIYRRIKDTTPARAEAQDEGAATRGWDREICTVCSSSLSLSDIKEGGFVSCCPDRRMVKVSDLVDAFEASRRAHPSPTPAADDDRVRIAVEAFNAKINAPLTGPTHGAWDRGRIAGLKEALAALKSEGK